MYQLKSATKTFLEKVPSVKELAAIDFSQQLHPAQ